MTFLQKTSKFFSLLAEQQELKGIKKYSKELDPLELKYDWLQMASEEQVDGFKYLHAEMEKREFITVKIKGTLINQVDDNIYDEVLFWLNTLNGDKE